MDAPFYYFFPEAKQDMIPVGLCYLGAVLKNKHDVKIYNPDLKFEGEENQYSNEMNDYKKCLENLKDPTNPIWEEIEKVIIKQNPDLIGISARTPSIESAKKTAQLIKKINPKIITVLGGAHASCLPSESAKFPFFDYVVRKEGEATIVELVDKLEKGEDCSGVAGITYKSNGKIIQNPERELIKELDTLPFPARDLIINKEIMHPDEFGLIFSSRGCPFQCTFCASHNLWTRRVRYRSPENVVQEMIEVHNKYKTEFFSFQDDTFTLNKERTKKICDLIIKANFKGNFRWVCNTRIDCLDEELAKKMAESGCVATALGIESGNDEVLKAMKKRTRTEQAIKAVKILNKYKIKFSGQFMIGLPYETEEQIKDTIRIMQQLDPISVMLSVATPLPGTEMYDYALKLGLIDRNIDWAKVTTKNDGIIFNPNKIPKERIPIIMEYAKKSFDEQVEKRRKEKDDYKSFKSEFQREAVEKWKKAVEQYKRENLMVNK